MTRIAVVEDDSGTSRLIGTLLQEHGHEVASYFAPSTDTLEHLRAYAPDLVILDARFKGSVSGWDIIAALKNDGATRAIPVIVCSGAIDQIEHNQGLLQEHDVPVLTKPFDIADLDALVEKTLAG